MKTKIFFMMMVLMLVLTACGSASPSEVGFPTGKFMSASSKYQGYRFNPDKTWQYLDYGMIGAEGTYRLKGNQWIENGTEECPFPGTYEWSFDGIRLTFKLVGEDKCEPRREATDGQIFVLSQ